MDKENDKQILESLGRISNQIDVIKNLVVVSNLTIPILLLLIILK